MKSRPPFRSFINRWGRFLFVTFAFVAMSAPACAQADIHWELVNPFRFIHDPKSVEKIRGIYGSLTDRSALALERALQRTNENRIDALRTAGMAACKASGQTEAECIKKYWYPYLGWFADVARNAHAKTCWDSSALSLRVNGPCADYIHPRKHRVRA